MIENKLPTRGYSYQSSTVKLYVIPISTVDKTSCTFVSRKLTKARNSRKRKMLSRQVTVFLLCVVTCGAIPCGEESEDLPTYLDVRKLPRQHS